MDAQLARHLKIINADRHSGAAELALRSSLSLKAWLNRHPRPSQNELLDVAWLLCRTQSMMAPFRNLANLVALAADTDRPVAYLRSMLRGFTRIVRKGPPEIAHLFRRRLARGRKVVVVTYSYSSTVLHSLIAARSRIEQVYVSLASPENEGRGMATRLAAAGVKTCLTTDVDLPGFLNSEFPMILVVGADQVREHDFVNRAGTEALVRRAMREGVSCWVLADTTKLCSRRRMRMADVLTGWHKAVLPRPASGVQVYRRILDTSPLAKGVNVMTENGPLSAVRVRGRISRIVVSPRLKQLVG